jgi:hypothetical protein
MARVLDPFRCVLITVAGWMNQRQTDVIDYLREENRVLREQLGQRRLRLNRGNGSVPKAGDVYDTAVLTKLIRGQDAVISAFNPGWKDPNLYEDQVRRTDSIIAAVKKQA